MGYCSDPDSKVYCDPSYTYSTSDFASPYNTSSTTPDLYSAPFVDLYLAKIIDFKPYPDSVGQNIAGVSVPVSKVYDWVGLRFFTQESNDTVVTELIQYPGAISIEIGEIGKALYSKTSSNIDKKIDDGIYNKGAFRTWYGPGNDCYIESSDTQCFSNYYRIIK